MILLQRVMRENRDVNIRIELMLLLQKIAEVVGKHMNKESWITVVIYMYMASVLLALILWVYRFIA